MLSLTEKNELLERAIELRTTRKYYELSLLVQHISPDELTVEPEFGHLLATAWKHMGNLQRAIELVRQTASVCVQRGNDSLFRRCLLLEGAILFDKGDLAEAETIFRMVLLQASNAGDRARIADATMNMGATAAIRCEWDTALSAFEHACVAFQVLGDHIRVADCHHNLAMVYRDLELLDKADTYFERAQAHYRLRGIRQMEAGTELERSLLFKQCGDLQMALVTSRRAFDCAVQLNDPRLRGEAARALGIILASRGQYDEARLLFVEGLERVSAVTAPLLQAELNEELAVLDYARGAWQQGAERAELANAQYLRAGAAARAARLCARLPVRPGIEV